MTIEDDQEPEMPTMFPIGQTVSTDNASSTGPNNDLAYLQEQLLRDKWLKIMSYSQKKKKKKKKKEKEKTDLPQNVATASTSASSSKCDEAKNFSSSPAKPVTEDCPLLLKALTKAETANVKKPFPPVKTYSKTEKRSDWFSKETDHTIFDSGSESDSSSTHQHPSIVQDSSRHVLTKGFNGMRRFSLQTDSSTTTTTSSTSQNNLPKSSTADEYEFSDNDDESAILNDKRFSSFKSNNFKESKNSSIGSSDQISFPISNGTFLSSKMKCLNSIKSQNLSFSDRKIQNHEKVESDRKVDSSATKINSSSESKLLTDSKAFSRKSSFSSISSSSDESIILKGSSSTTTTSSSSSSSSSSPRRSRLNSTSSIVSGGGKSITENVTPVQAGNQLEDDGLNDEMEPDLVCSSEVVCNKNVSSLIEDEILGDGESRGGKTPEVDEPEVDKTSTPCPTKAPSTKYKSNRYYKPSQSAVLWEFYRKNAYPSKAEQAALAEQLGGIEIKRIIWWFTHRRRTDKNNPEFAQLLSQGVKKVKSKLQDAASKEVSPSLGADASLACGVTNTCALCSFSDLRPKLLRHLKSKHGYKPTVCRRCQKIWQQAFFEEHPCTTKKSPKKKSSAGNKSPPKKAILLEDKLTPEKAISLEDKPTGKNAISIEDKMTGKKAISLEDKLAPKKAISIEDKLTSKKVISLEDKTTSKTAISIEDELTANKILNGKKKSPKKKNNAVQELQKVQNDLLFREEDLDTEMVEEAVEEKTVPKVKAKCTETAKEEEIAPTKEGVRILKKSKSEKTPCKGEDLPRKATVIAIKKSDRKEMSKQMLTPEVIEKDNDLPMDITSPVIDDSVLVQTPTTDQPDISTEDIKMEEVVDDDDDDGKEEEEESILPIGFGTRCSSCPYDGPNILRHFQAIHRYKGKKCRKCGHFWQIEQIEDHPCDDQPNHFRERPQDLKERPLLQQSKKSIQREVDDDEEDEDIEEDEEECYQVEAKFVFRAPTKQELKAPIRFYSRRYKELLSQFSPKKLSKDCPGLSDLLQSSRFQRNGKLDLNYITPTQLEAVQEFMLGDRSVRVRQNPKIWPIN